MVLKSEIFFTHLVKYDILVNETKAGRFQITHDRIIYDGAGLVNRFFLNIDLQLC